MTSVKTSSHAMTKEEQTIVGRMAQQEPPKSYPSPTGKPLSFYQRRVLPSQSLAAVIAGDIPRTPCTNSVIMGLVSNPTGR